MPTSFTESLLQVFHPEHCTFLAPKCATCPNHLILLAFIVMQLNPDFTFLWGPPKNGMKYGKHCSEGHSAATVQKVHKVAQNAKCGNVKSRF